MDRHIPHRAAAEVIPAAPVGRMILPVGIGNFLCRSQPEIPVERGGHGGGNRIGAVIAPGFAAPGVHLPHLPDRAALHELHCSAVGSGGMDLRSHLRDELRLFCHHPQLPRFMHIVRQRLLAVDMLAAIEGRHRRGGMGVVGGGDIDRIDLARHLIEHPAEVGKLFRVCMLGCGGAQIVGVDIAQRHHIDRRMGRERFQIGRSHSPHADARQPQPLATGRLRQQSGERECIEGGAAGGGAQKKRAARKKRARHGDVPDGKKILKSPAASPGLPKTSPTHRAGAWYAFAHAACATEYPTRFSGLVPCGCGGEEAAGGESL